MSATSLCRLQDVPDGGARGFDPGHQGQDTVFVVRHGQALHAWLDSCPHNGTPLAWRKDAYLNRDGSRIVCSAHGAQFDVHTGACTLGPALGQSLTRVALRCTQEGEIHLALTPPTETTP